MERGHGDILGNHQTIAAASMNNAPPSICWACCPMHLSPFISRVLYSAPSPRLMKTLVSTGDTLGTSH